jgi:hypothetical protein
VNAVARTDVGQPESDGNIHFIGRDLPYSHGRPGVALQKPESAGFTIASAEHIETAGHFLWVIARRFGW